MESGSSVVLLLQEDLEHFGWEVYAAFALGALAVCVLINLLAGRDLKRLVRRKRRSKKSHTLFC
jgi:hypothetical protein